MSLFNNLKDLAKLAEQKLNETELGKTALNKLDEIQQADVVQKIKQNANEFKSELQMEIDKVRQQSNSIDDEKKAQYENNSVEDFLTGNVVKKERNPYYYHNVNNSGFNFNKVNEYDKSDNLLSETLKATEQYASSQVKPSYGSTITITETKNDTKELPKSEVIQEVQTELYDTLNAVIKDKENNDFLYQNINMSELIKDKDEIGKVIVQKDEHYTSITNNQKSNNAQHEEMSQSQFQKLTVFLRSLNKQHLIDVVLKLFGFKNKNLQESMMQTAMRKSLETLSTWSLLSIALFLFRTLFRAYGWKFVLISTIGTHFLFKKAKQTFNDNLDTEAGIERARAEEYFKKQENNNT